MSPSGLPITIQAPNSPTTFAYPGHIKKTHHFLDRDPAVRYAGLGDGLSFSLGLLDGLPAMDVRLEDLDEVYAKAEGREPAFNARRRSTLSDTVTDGDVQISHTLGKGVDPPRLSAVREDAAMIASTVPSAVPNDPMYPNFANTLPMYQQQQAQALSNVQPLSQSALLLQGAGNTGAAQGGYPQDSGPWQHPDRQLDASAKQNFHGPTGVQGTTFYSDRESLYQTHPGLGNAGDSFDPSMTGRLSGDSFTHQGFSAESPTTTPPYSPEAVISSHGSFSLPLHDSDRSGSTNTSPTQSLKRSTPESEIMDYYGPHPQLSGSTFNPHYPGNQHKPPHPPMAAMMRAGSPSSMMRKRTKYDNLQKQQQLQLQQVAIDFAASCAQQRLGPIPMGPSQYPATINIEPQPDTMHAQQQLNAVVPSQTLGAPLESPLSATSQQSSIGYPTDNSALANWNAMAAAQGLGPHPAMMQGGWATAPPPGMPGDHSSSPSPHNEVSGMIPNKFHGGTGVINQPQPTRRIALQSSRGSLPGNYSAMPDSDTLHGLYKPSTPISASANPGNYNPTAHYPRQMPVIPPNHPGRRGSLTLQHHGPGVPGASGNIGQPHQVPPRRISGASPYQPQQHHQQVPQHRSSPSDVYMS